MFDPRKNYNVTNGLLCSMDPIGRAQLEQRIDRDRRLEREGAE